MPKISAQTAKALETPEEFKTPLPEHIGFICDGNRRWAKDRRLPTLQGHQRGYEIFRRITKYAFERGIKELSFWVFSTENWNRSDEEVQYLMNLARKVFKKESSAMHKENIKVRVAGSRDKVPTDILRMIDEIVEKTKNNTKGIVNFLFSYGGRADILQAVQKLIRAGTKADGVTEDVFSQALSTAGMRDVDLIIRTGEHRLSGFLPWESGYAEIYITPDTYWPDFDEAEFDKALAFFASRQRRFGK